MRKISKGLLVVVAALGFVAVPASASTLGVLNEATGTICPAVTLSGTDVNGGCLIHANSEGTVELRKHVFGIESHITACNSEFHGRISSGTAIPGSAATGYIFEQVLSGAGCSRQACAFVGEAKAWPFTAFEGAGQSGAAALEHMATNLCFEPVGGGTDETCEIDLPFHAHEPGWAHYQEIGYPFELSSHGISGFRCELVGHWLTEVGGTHDGDAEVEIYVLHLV
jgi:hypothetical protein